MKQKRIWWTSILLFSACGSVLGQGAATWTVKPEWVRAHEEFLASDAMRGRGSATHDEEITATYVASEFRGYGLQPAPGTMGFLQVAGVVAPALDGQARLSAGNFSLHEAADFDLVISPALDARGTLVRVAYPDLKTAKIPQGAAVLLTGAPDPRTAFRALDGLHRAGATMVLLPGTGAMAGTYARIGGHTRLPVHLADQPEQSHSAITVVQLHPASLAGLEALKDGTPVSLAVHEDRAAGKRSTYNAIGYLPGTDPAAGTILLSAHLDHLGISVPVNGDAIYNGANDDAAGTTAVLELAHALANGPRLRRSVLFVCYGSEEIGELGSTYFGEHPPVPLKSLVANLEFEMIGNQDPKMPPGVLLFTGWDRSNLGPTLKAHGALLGPDPYPEQHFFERSDNYALALKGVVAHTAAGWGTPPTYHQPSDDLAHLDLPFMTAAIQSLVEPVRWLADSDFTPQWNTGGQPESAK
ncbi:MAG: M28 family peptidase [Janthinobacterium lividum]